METRTLLLNSWGLPHAILSWQDAICLVYQDKVLIQEEYDEIISSPSTSYFIPAVIQLKKAVATVKKGLKFSRINVFTRDGFKCQYCGQRKTMRELNYDHVVPRKQGGQTTWLNIATSCYSCNEKKADRTPEQAGMKLLRKPAKPHSLPLHAVYLEAGKVPSVWGPYLDWSQAQQHGSGYYLVASSAA